MALLPVIGVHVQNLAFFQLPPAHDINFGSDSCTGTAAAMLYIHTVFYMKTSGSSP